MVISEDIIRNKLVICSCIRCNEITLYYRRYSFIKYMGLSDDVERLIDGSLAHVRYLILDEVRGI
jgi:hypothetical protein